MAKYVGFAAELIIISLLIHWLALLKHNHFSDMREFKNLLGKFAVMFAIIHILK